MNNKSKDPVREFYETLIEKSNRPAGLLQTLTCAEGTFVSVVDLVKFIDFIITQRTDEVVIEEFTQLRNELFKLAS